MAKPKVAFVCQSCGSTYAKWSGQCVSCKSWNTLVEEVLHRPPSGGSHTLSPSKALSFDEITTVDNEARLSTSLSEFDRVLGGGLFPGSLILLGGEPGIGKSTLLLQTTLGMNPKKVLYVSGEESAPQIKNRADRILEGSLATNHGRLLTETWVEQIVSTAVKENPDFLIVDSIQTLQSEALDSPPGSVSQVRESASMLLKFAKESGTPVLLIGHITKDGQLAGPKVLEHMVDVVLQFEGDRNHVFRILRAQKNRFGPASEIGIFEMNQQGLHPVHDPSGALFSEHALELSGTSHGIVMEGIRPLVLETQALVSSAVYGTPQRSATGFDLRRLNMLLAVLEKRCGFSLGSKDVFLNLTGGIRIEDPALDLAIMAAILSSAEDQSIGGKTAFSGEVGLTGEIRPVNRIESRINEAEKLGFKTLFLPSYNLKGLNVQQYSIALKGIDRIGQLYHQLFSP